MKESLFIENFAFGIVNEIIMKKKKKKRNKLQFIHNPIGIVALCFLFVCVRVYEIFVYIWFCAKNETLWKIPPSNLDYSRKYQQNNEHKLLWPTMKICAKKGT